MTTAETAAETPYSNDLCVVAYPVGGAAQRTVAQVKPGQPGGRPPGLQQSLILQTGLGGGIAQSTRAHVDVHCAGMKPELFPVGQQNLPQKLGKPE